MPRNGSGQFSAITNSWNPAINGLPATAADWQAVLNDIVSALTQSVSRDGQTAMTGNLPMAGNKVTGLGNATATGDALTFAQLFSQGQQQDVPAAATTDIGAQLSTLINVTGAATITSFGTNYNGPRFLRFAGVCTLTNSATLVLPGGANITTAAGDSLIAVPLGNPATGWRVVASSGSSLVGYLPSGTGAVATTVQSKLREGVSVKDFGAVGDGVTDDTVAIQAAIDYASANGMTLFTPPGVYRHTGLTISKPLKWVGSAIRGPVYGVQTNFKGAVFKHIATSGDALTITAASLLSNQGLCVEMGSLVFDGNKDVVGATAGGGIHLIGDTAGEAFFVHGSVFRNVQVRNAKGDAWKITGTCFLNSWYDCAGVYSEGYGLTHNKGAGSPVNNNWFGGYLSDNGLFGLNCNGGKMTMTATNISQNAGGGVNHDSGYLILNNCDFEQNSFRTIAVVNSSAATYVIGGMIHKTPGGAAHVAIEFGSGCAANQIDGVLFANFDNVGDRLISFSGDASLELFNFRQQNCLASSFPTSIWPLIASIPTKEKVRTGRVTFSGSGIGLRTATVSFSPAFEQDYTIVLTPNGEFGTTDGLQVSFDGATKALGSITAQCYVSNAAFGAVSASYIAIGR